MSSSTAPVFSIILPVKNGGEYLKDCVRSILLQTVEGFNLIILDSGSTDGTLEWLQSINDHRIKIYPAEKPLSITGNWNRIRTIPRNEWMTIIGHDDLLLPGYLETVSALINLHPEASLYQTHFNLVDKDSRFMRNCKSMPGTMQAYELLNKMLDNEINVYGTGFMMRSSDYDRAGGIPLFPNLMSADYVLWLKMTAISYIAVDERTCFSYRVNQSTTATTKMNIYIEALKLFIDYLITSKSQLAPEEDRNSYIKRILTFYCKRVSRRLITVPLAERNNLTVSAFLAETETYAGDLLDKGELFNPSASFDVRIAKLIDSTAATRKIFSLVKKIYPNPIIK